MSILLAAHTKAGDVLHIEDELHQRLPGLLAFACGWIIRLAPP
jgi:hypothetical protein